MLLLMLLFCLFVCFLNIYCFDFISFHDNGVCILVEKIIFEMQIYQNTKVYDFLNISHYLIFLGKESDHWSSAHLKCLNV